MVTWVGYLILFRFNKHTPLNMCKNCRDTSSWTKPGTNVHEESSSQHLFDMFIICHHIFYLLCEPSSNHPSIEFFLWKLHKLPTSKDQKKHWLSSANVNSTDFSWQSLKERVYSRCSIVSYFIVQPFSCPMFARNQSKRFRGWNHWWGVVGFV